MGSRRTLSTRSPRAGIRRTVADGWRHARRWERGAPCGLVLPAHRPTCPGKHLPSDSSRAFTWLGVRWVTRNAKSAPDLQRWYLSWVQVVTWKEALLR